MSDSGYEGSENEEIELPLEFFGFTRETSFKDVPLTAPEFLSPVGVSEIDMREIESSHRIFGESLVDGHLKANLIEEIEDVLLREGVVHLVVLKRLLFET